MDKVTVTKKELSVVIGLWGRSHNAERLYEILALMDHGKQYTVDEFAEHCPGVANSEYVMDAIRAFNVAIDLRALPDMATKEEKLRAASKYYECDYDGKRHHYRHEFKYAPKWYVKRDSIIDDRDYKFTPKPRAIKWCIYYGHFPSKCICPWNGQCYNVSGGGSLCGTYEKRCGWDDDMYDTWCFMNGNLWDYVGENYVGMS